MNVKIAPDWQELLAPEFEKPYFAQLVDFVRNEYATQRIYPRGSNIFRAFDKCPFEKLKVVIIGQDPYHGEGQANGLCFFGERRYSLSPVVAEHLSGDIDRHRYARSFDRQSRPVGRTGRPAAQFGTDRAGPSGRFARRTRVGNLHRCRRPCHRRAQNGDRLHALGQLRPAQRRDRQPAEQLHTESRPPLSAFGLPRILRLPALLAGQRISPEPRKEPIVW